MAFYNIPPEVWGVEKCREMARRIRLPFSGYIGSSCMPPQYGGYGKFRYNGGCIRDGEWYEGEIRPLPIIPTGFEIIVVPSWGFRIIETTRPGKPNDIMELTKIK